MARAGGFAPPAPTGYLEKLEAEGGVMPVRTFLLILACAILAGGLTVAALASGAPEMLPLIGVLAAVAALALRLRR